MYEQSKSVDRLIPINTFVQQKYYEQFMTAVDKLQYWSDKCLYKNQGELIAKAELQKFINNVFEIKDS